MKNREKYREEILNCRIADENFCDIFIEPNILKPLGIKRSEILCGQCHLICAMWLEEEYKEPKQEVDWSKVAVDTPILVRESEHNRWTKRYFAKYENGKVFAWNSGATSWASDDLHTSWWNYAKLADIKEEEEWVK
ncbi:hypothetical protein [Anaerostipes faecalis]|uniref:hypothetical protein n=1 Tax=Anaerostipes faecalis TaxID=2738446 RepID=UPI003F0CF0B6